MSKEIDITMMNKLQVSGLVSCPTHASESFHDLVAVHLRFKVARYVRPFQLYEEMERFDDEYEENCLDQGIEWNRFAFEDEIECRICCSKADYEFLCNMQNDELATVAGSLGNPLVEKIRNKDGDDEYAGDLQPTTLFLDSICFHRIGKEIHGDPRMSVPDRPAFVTIDGNGDIDDIVAVPTATHYVIQRY